MSDAQDMTTPEAREAYYRPCWEIATTEVGRLRAELAARATSRRRELLEQAVIEAARGYLAAHLRWERAAGQPHDLADDRAMTRDDALQTLRDAAWAERRARGEDAGPVAARCVVPNCHAGMLRDRNGRDSVSCPICDGVLTPDTYRSLVAAHDAPMARQDADKETSNG